MATLVQFSRNMKKRATQVENAPARLLRRIGRRTLRALLEATPVDKGVARSNWRVSLGSRTTAVIPAYSPGKNLGRGERGNFYAALDAGYQVLDQLRPGRGFRVSTAMYITNNAPYIERLNAGYSKQTAAGFVQVATAEAKAAVSGFRVFDRTIGGDD